MMHFFELQGDEGDEERVKLNLIQLAEEQGILKRTENKDEIRFEGQIEIKGDFVNDYLKKKMAGLK